MPREWTRSPNSRAQALARSFSGVSCRSGVCRVVMSGMPSVSAMRGMVFVASVPVGCGMPLRRTDVRRQHLTAAVVATIDNALADGVEHGVGYRGVEIEPDGAQGGDVGEKRGLDGGGGLVQQGGVGDVEPGQVAHQGLTLIAAGVTLGGVTISSASTLQVRASAGITLGAVALSATSTIGSAASATGSATITLGGITISANATLRGWYVTGTPGAPSWGEQASGANDWSSISPQVDVWSPSAAGAPSWAPSGATASTWTPLVPT